MRAPWQQPRGSEKYELEDQSHHIMVCDEIGAVLGVGRLHMNNPTEAQLRYMAVVENQQNKGIGKLILKNLETIDKQLGANNIILNARQSVLGFYEKHGYHITGPAHTLYDSILYSRMSKSI